MRDQCSLGVGRAREERKETGRRLGSWRAPFSLKHWKLDMVVKPSEKNNDRVRDGALESKPRLMG